MVNNVTLIAPTDFTEIKDQLTFSSGATTKVWWFNGC